MKQTINIEQVFYECLEAVLSGRATVAGCLERYPEHAAELEGLLLTSFDVSKAAAFDPPAGARMRVRVALNERMAELAASKKRALPFWKVGWANAVVTFVLGLSLTGGGVAYAASGAMPGEALYSLKLNLEQVMLNATFSQDARIELYAALNDRRVDELLFLAEKGDAAAMIAVTARMEDNFVAAAGLKGLSADAIDRAASSPPFFTATEQAPPAVAGGSALAPSIKNDTAGLTVVVGSSALDAALRDHAGNQLTSLNNAALANAGSNNTVAVQLALEQAIAAVSNGYDLLLSQPEK
jgi:hypothetical protein